MNVLFVTAYYPPCNSGWGYMRICELVADGFVERGHSVAVLTSNYQDGPETKSYPIHRKLHIDPDWQSSRRPLVQFFNGRLERESQDVEALLALNETFQPDIIFVWHADGLSRKMLQMAENLATAKTVYYFANYYPLFTSSYTYYWNSKSRSPVVQLLKWVLTPLAKGMLKQEGKPISLKFEHSISVSTFVKNELQNMIGEDAVTIPNGVDVDAFYGDVSQGGGGKRPLKYIIAGRIAPEKGIHTVLKAINHLVRQGIKPNLHLTVIGGGEQPYINTLLAYVEQYELHPYVTFDQPIPIEEMPNKFHEHDVLILPSEWDEPLSCTMLEAMAAGLMVVGTTTGGSGEALSHRETGLVFEAKNAEELAEQLLAVEKEPALIPDLAQQGQQLVMEQFTIAGTTERIEEQLLNLIGQKKVIVSEAQ